MRLRVSIIVACLSLVALATGFKSCGKYSVSDAVKQVARSGNGGLLIATDKMQVTPLGSTVFGKTEMPASSLEAIDTGLTRLFKSAAADGIDQALDHRFYTIYTPPYQCQQSPVQHIPSFLVRSDPYDGTEYDQYNTRGAGVKDGIGVTFAAEAIISFGTPGSTIETGAMYVCPDMPVLPDAVSNGADHIILANDTDAYPDGNSYFYCSLYHFDQGYGAINHPLIPRNGRCMGAGSGTARTANPVIPQPEDLGEFAGFKLRRAIAVGPTK